MADLSAKIIATLRGEGLELKDGDIITLGSHLIAATEDGASAHEPRDSREPAVPERSLRPLAQRRFPAGRVSQFVRTTWGVVQDASGPARSAPGQAIVEPRDPDASAALLKARLEKWFLVNLGVIITGTSSQPWRRGRLDFALGAAGLNCLDESPGPDSIQDTGEPSARGDAVANATALIRGASADFSLAIVRGVGELVCAEAPGARTLIRDDSETWFRHGHVEAIHAALGAGNASISPPSGTGDDDLAQRLRRAIAVAQAHTGRTPGQAGWTLTAAPAGSHITISPSRTRAETRVPGEAHPVIAHSTGLGAIVERLCTALHAEDLQGHADWSYDDQGVPAGAQLTISINQEA